MINVHKKSFRFASGGKNNFFLKAVTIIGAVFFVILVFYIGKGIYKTFRDPFMEQVSDKSVFYLHSNTLLWDNVKRETFSKTVSIGVLARGVFRESFNNQISDIIAQEPGHFGLNIIPGSNGVITGYVYIKPLYEKRVLKRLDENQINYIKINSFLVLAQKEEDLEKLFRSYRLQPIDFSYKNYWNYYWNTDIKGFFNSEVLKQKNISSNMIPFASYFQDTGLKIFKADIVDNQVLLKIQGDKKKLELSNSLYPLIRNNVNYDDIKYLVNFSRSFDELGSFSEKLQKIYPDYAKYLSFQFENFRVSALNGISNNEIGTFLNADFILAGFNYNGGFVLGGFYGKEDLSQKEIELFEHMAKLKFAWEKPNIDNQSLSDWSTISLINADPSSFVFKEYPGSLPIKRMVGKDEKLYEMFYSIQGDNLIFSTSVEHLGLILSDYGNAEQNQWAEKSCFKDPELVLKDVNISRQQVSDLELGFSKNSLDLCITF